MLLKHQLSFPVSENNEWGTAGTARPQHRMRGVPFPLQLTLPRLHRGSLQLCAASGRAPVYLVGSQCDDTELPSSGGASAAETSREGLPQLSAQCFSRKGCVFAHLGTHEAEPSPVWTVCTQDGFGGLSSGCQQGQGPQTQQQLSAESLTGVGRDGWTSCSESHSTGPSRVAPGATGHWAVPPSGVGREASGLRCHRSRASPQGSAVL